mgnify:CR=1 FL=1
MNEQEILTQLRKAAEEIEIPETLKPEQIEKQLQEQKAKQQQENQHLKPKKSKKIIPWRRLGSMVAVLALVVCSGIYITVTRFDKNSGTGQTDSVAMTDTQQTVGEAGETGMWQLLEQCIILHRIIRRYIRPFLRDISRTG